MSDLSELFERNPLLLTDQDIVKIVARMREAYTKHELGAKPPPKPKAPKAPTKSQNLLKDLGLA